MQENKQHNERQAPTSPIIGVQASDNLQVTETVHIDVFQSGGLVAFTRKLAVLTDQAYGQQEQRCLAIATILTASAALEALLSEFAYLTNRSAYTREFRKAGVSKKYKLLTGNDLASIHPDISELWDHRIAIGHSEPENPRSRNYGSRINKAGAMWAADTIEKFARDLWGRLMPEWFRSDSGL